MYYFKPMMAIYGKIILAETGWLMSVDGRRLIAKAVRHCRNTHGRDRGREFFDALTVNGAIYPILRGVLDRYSA